MDTFTVILLLMAAYCFYLMFRNSWVYRARIRFIGTDEYENLPSYNHMLYLRPFCWDINKFLK